MSTIAELQRKQLEKMTTEQISIHIQQIQQELNTFLDQLFTRAHVQEYTEQQYEESLLLLQEALAFIEEVPVDERDVSEWAGKRKKLMDQIQKKL
jgi:queuine/archaeosine tRNA-ribosyltransferase